LRVVRLSEFRTCSPSPLPYLCDPLLLNLAGGPVGTTEAGVVGVIVKVVTGGEGHQTLDASVHGDLRELGGVRKVEMDLVRETFLTCFCFCLSSLSSLPIGSAVCDERSEASVEGFVSYIGGRYAADASLQPSVLRSSSNLTLSFIWDILLVSKYPIDPASLVSKACTFRRMPEMKS